MSMFTPFSVGTYQSHGKSKQIEVSEKELGELCLGTTEGGVSRTMIQMLARKKNKGEISGLVVEAKFRDSSQ